MATWIALLRGINVGGHNRLPMKSLIAVLEGLGATDVQTYIQSGNAIFSSPARSASKLGEEIGTAIEAEHGFKPRVLVLKPADFKKAASLNPFPKAEDENDGKALHVMFLSKAPTAPDTGALDAAKHASESWKLIGKCFYLHAPGGLHKSKLAAKAERVLGVTATARNWRTVARVIALVP